MSARRHRRAAKVREKTIVAAVVRILKAGEPTAFRFEGSCRHGLRSGFCLDGHSWDAADQKSTAIIGEALRRLHAERPTWWQGQPEYADTDTSRGWCARLGCGRPIPVERRSSLGAAVRYCSHSCQERAHAQRQRANGGSLLGIAEHLAACAARSQETLLSRVRDCAHCGKTFLSRAVNRKYCSRGCFFADQTIHAERPCEHCGAAYRPEKTHLGLSKYCSRKCADAGRIKARPERQCPTCGTIFRPKNPSDKKRFCGHACADRWNAAKRVGASGLAEPSMAG